MQPDPNPTKMRRPGLFRRLFPRRDPVIQKTVDTLYEQIVAAARQPFLYSDWQVPDTPLGRYEMLSLHLFLFLRRVRGEEGPIRGIAQELTDGFFQDMDHSIRELGVSDVGVPKRMKKLSRMFYGRVTSYGDALDREDGAALAAALARNVWPDLSDRPEAGNLATYTTAAARALEGQGIAAFLDGRVSFAPPAGAAP